MKRIVTLRLILCIAHENSFLETSFTADLAKFGAPTIPTTR